MARKKKNDLRYIVTGPSVEEDLCFDNVGGALSRSITCATRAQLDQKATEGTWYIRDSVLDRVLGHSEIREGLIVTVRHPEVAAK